MQLESLLLPVIANLNSLMNTGMGLGKIICMVLPILLDFFISMRAHPMSLQVTEFAQYGIDAQSINSDTPEDADLSNCYSFLYLTCTAYSKWLLPGAYHCTRVIRQPQWPSSPHC